LRAKEQEPSGERGRTASDWEAVKRNAGGKKTPGDPLLEAGLRYQLEVAIRVELPGKGWKGYDAELAHWPAREKPPSLGIDWSLGRRGLKGKRPGKKNVEARSSSQERKHPAPGRGADLARMTTYSCRKHG